MLYQVSIKACIIDHHSTMVPYYDIDRVSIGSVIIVTELLYINKVATVSAGTGTRFSDLKELVWPLRNYKTLYSALYQWGPDSLVVSNRWLIF